MEHSRIFIFHNKGENKVYMGSADWMKRNLSDRIEIIFPILDTTLQKEVIQYVTFQLNDNVKLRMLDSSLANIAVPRKKDSPLIRAQFHIYEWLKKSESKEGVPFHK